MAKARRDKCKECGREVIWIKNQETGATLPLDASAPTYTISQNLLGETVALPADAKVSHFSTCTRAGRERFSAGGPIRKLKQELARG